MSSEDDTKDDPTGDDKQYIVDKKIDVELTEEEKRTLKQEKAVDEDYLGRQDIFTDRRDTFREDDYNGDERRSGTDRRDEE